MNGLGKSCQMTRKLVQMAKFVVPFAQFSFPWAWFAIAIKENPNSNPSQKAQSN